MTWPLLLDATTTPSHGASTSFEQFWIYSPKGPSLPRMFPFGLAVLQKNIKMSQVYRRQMPSDGTSSHGPEPGELKREGR